MGIHGFRKFMVEQSAPTTFRARVRDAPLTNYVNSMLPVLPPTTRPVVKAGEPSLPLPEAQTEMYNHMYKYQ